MTMRLIVLEGVDGAGTSFQTDALTLSLRAVGVDARAFHHKRPSLGDPFRDALAYAEQRAALVASKPSSVIVADRWHWSTRTEGECLASLSLDHLHCAEHLRLPPALLTVILTAPDAVLDERLTARGETVTYADLRRRLAYRELAAELTAADPPCHVVDTSQPTPDVTRALLRLSLKALGVEVSL